MAAGVFDRSAPLRRVTLHGGAAGGSGETGTGVSERRGARPRRSAAWHAVVGLSSALCRARAGWSGVNAGDALHQTPIGALRVLGDEFPREGAGFEGAIEIDQKRDAHCATSLGVTARIGVPVFTLFG